MRERLGLIIKVACGVLAALLLYQLSRAFVRVNPLARISVPALPALADAQTAKGTNAPPAASAKGTNAPPRASGTNSLAVTNAVGTNVVGTNVVGTNVVGTNVVGTNVAGTNAAKVLAKGTNSSSNAPVVLAEATNAVPVRPGPDASATNSAEILAALAKATNLPANMRAMMSTNALMATNAPMGTNDPLMIAAGTNAARRGPAGANPAAAREMAMAAANARPGAPRKPADLPPEIKARIDRIIESEIMGTIMRPLPMALLGIAGNSVLLRTPTGQTGLVKEGDELGGVKVLQVGIDRVLVEEQGQKKELTLFSGLGSESLLSRQKETPDETTKK